VCCNFRNIPKTLARVCQIIQSKYWGDPKVSTWEEIHVSGGSPRVVADLPYCDQLVAGFGVDIEDTVFEAKTAEVRGTEYQRQTVVVLQNGIETEDNLPVFGKISDVLVVHSSVVLLLVDVWTTLFYNEHLRAYAAQWGKIQKSWPKVVFF